MANAAKGVNEAKQVRDLVKTLHSVWKKSGVRGEVLVDPSLTAEVLRKVKRKFDKRHIPHVELVVNVVDLRFYFEHYEP